MRILVTNDDGIDAAGIQALREIAGQLSDDVWVIAPEANNSGVSHSLTIHNPLRIMERTKRVYVVRGTPTDCVLIGVNHVMKDHPPDLVLSGINLGSNVADDITYSGTVAGAMEGSFFGIPSIALSLAGSHEPDKKFHWQTPKALAPALLSRMLKEKWPADVVLNINFPDLEPKEVKGVLVTTQGHRTPNLINIEERNDPSGHPYYWIGYKRRQPVADKGSDLWAINNGYISVTPLRMDMTHHETYQSLQKRLHDLDVENVNGQAPRLTG